MCKVIKPRKALLELVNRKWAFFGSEYWCYFFTIAVAMDISTLAMGTSLSYVLACVVSFHLKVCIESFNFLKMACGE